MHNRQAVSVLQNADARPERAVSIRFVSPILSVMIAARNTLAPLGGRLSFSRDCKTYAENNGLSRVLDGTYSFPTRSGLQGVTYTKLCKLSSHAEVEKCNELINDLIDEQFESLFGSRICNHFRKVVGELHDNVASHANGLGFSCAQTYKFGEGRCLEFAIADCGCGMLRNVRRHRADIENHADAIEWCMTRGNTTAIMEEDWAQRLPADSVVSPFPNSVETFAHEDHHVGEGLWILSELIRLTSGSVWIASGDGRFHSPGRCVQEEFHWQGVAIEFEIKSDGRPLSAKSRDEVEALAERLGL